VVGRGEPAVGQGLAARVHAEFDDALVVGGDAAFPDADAAADPGVVGLDRLGELVVGDDPGGPVVAEREDARARGRVGDAEPGAHRVCALIRSRALSRSAGVFRATRSTPLSSRLASPVSVPAGGSSMIAVTPISRMVSMQASQRTGALTCSTSRSTNS